MKERKPLNMEIGSRIKSARENIGITQEVFAEKIGVTTQYISDLERGVAGASIATIIKICEILSVSSDYILMGKDDKASSDTLANYLQYLTPKQIELVKRNLQILLDAFRL